MFCKSFLRTQILLASHFFLQSLFLFNLKYRFHISKAHIAIAECEKRLKEQGRKVVVITQNIDELHKTAGSENILELHGEYCYFTHEDSLF